LLGLILILIPLATGWLFKRVSLGDRRSGGSSNPQDV
jgi:hypothetical protein